MFMKKILAAGIVAATMTTGASAATFDFATLADQAKAGAPAGAGVEATFDQAQPGGWTVDGITVNAGADHYGGIASHAFLDAGNAGLGVCSSGFTGTISNCATGGPGTAQGDDNVTFLERLLLDFSSSVSLVDLVFRGANHGLATGSIYISTDVDGNFGDFYNIANGKLSDVDLDAIGVSSFFSFEYDNIGANPTEFYVSSIQVAAVPLPASMAFLLAGLGGLGLAKRRRKSV